MPEHRHVGFLIIGSGPAGLGAALRLDQLGREDWLLVERSESPGGLSSTFEKDEFLFDLGGHVIFAHSIFFDQVLQEAVGNYEDDEIWATHPRKSCVLMGDGVRVPYPFQNNLQALDDRRRDSCIDGLLCRSTSPRKPANFDEYITRNFGKGIGKEFLQPYNRKVWAHDPKTMDTDWLGERVASVDVTKVVSNVLYKKEDVAYGPNATFRYPMTGGTGAIYSAISEILLPPERQLYSREVIRIDMDNKKATLGDGTTVRYDYVVSTVPFRELSRICDFKNKRPDLDTLVTEIRHSSTHVIGFGVRGSNRNRDTCWVYSPQPEVPWYRATILSNYSPNMVPRSDNDQYYSIMLEVAEGPASFFDFRTKSTAQLVEECHSACVTLGLIGADDRIVTTFYKRLEYGYPTPVLGNTARTLRIADALCSDYGIYSRGRFGLAQYQISNQDQAMMQGAQAIDNALFGTLESVMRCPSFTNGRYDRDYQYV